MSLLGTAKSLLHAHPGQGDRQGTDRILASMAYPKRKMTGPYREGVGGSRDCKARMLRAHSHTQTAAGCCPQARDATEGKVAIEQSTGQEPPVHQRDLLVPAQVRKHHLGLCLTSWDSNSSSRKRGPTLSRRHHLTVSVLAEGKLNGM